jgi:glyoxylase-like metal-dependent hydrolase (beta-lactamase superfamily II)
VDGHCFSGDTLFHYSIGRSDFYGGDYRTMMNSIKDVLFNLPEDTVLLPGHMDLSTIGTEKRGNPFV